MTTAPRWPGCPASASGRAAAEWRGRRFLRATVEDPQAPARPGMEGVRHVAEHIIKRTDASGSPLPPPEEELNCRRTTLPCQAETCVRLCHDHATGEQCHAELKDDMRMERLPGGRMPSNAFVLQCPPPGFNRLRRIGRFALEYGRRRPSTGNARQRARGRMRARTVIDTCLRVAGRVVRHAGREILRLGASFAGFRRFQWIHRQCCLTRGLRADAYHNLLQSRSLEHGSGGGCAPVRRQGRQNMTSPTLDRRNGCADERRHSRLDV